MIVFQIKLCVADYVQWAPVTVNNREYEDKIFNLFADWHESVDEQ